VTTWIVEIGQQCAAAHSGPLRRRVDRDLVEQAEVDHQSVVDDTRAPRMVSTAPDGDLQAVLAGERECIADVLGALAPRDHGRAPVDCRVPHLAGVVVPRIFRAENRPPDHRT
jgi:hypothetical protein